MKPLSCLLLAATLVLSGCGYSRTERAGSGAVIGATVGGVGGLLCCGDPVDGMAIGVVGGAIVGGAIGAMLDDPILMDYKKQN